MLRITEYSEDNGIVLRLDGTITCASFTDLETTLSQHLGSNGRRIVLDMSGVGFMHDQAAQKIAKLRSEAFQVINCSPFIAALLDMAASTD